MENKRRLRVLLAIMSVSAAISILLVSEYRRRRSRRQKCHRSSCYLQADPKPQCSFKRVLADNSFSAFKHLSTLHSSKESASNSHPYEAEITKLLESPRLEFELTSGNGDVEMSESYIWVGTESRLKDLAATLSKERIFAVDTEQHSLRSFLGFTALVQVSTRKEDYLVDTIALHDFMGHLRPVFADPSICKVFHGADNDVLWLQRDFHIYVVNLFDTAKACEILSKPQKSLAYLLETYCGVITNKLLQREDWRQRPLSVEMVQYARTDAHYLLYIANCLIAEMEKLENENSSPDDKFRFVLEASRRSNMISMQLYTKETETSPGESAALSIFSRYVNGQGGIPSTSCEFQDRVRRLCAWRDLMARVHDESCRYVLSDQAIIALADKAPTTSKDICSIVSQADLNVDSNFASVIPSPSPVVCSHLDDFYGLLLDKIDNIDDVFPTILQKCLGSKGSCPLSVFNYALLLNCDLKLALVSKQNATRNPKQAAKKTSRQLFVQKFSCKSPVYHNCRIYANDGRLLCYCDQKKLEWYINRGLAKVVDENPPAIMLLFEPKGRPEDEDNDFYIQSKKNICVGCGEGNHYLRYRIIPSCYRMHFPEHLKSHRSHDIVLLCVDCHEVAHAAAEKHKRQVAEEFGVPLFVRKVLDAEEAQSLSGLSESANSDNVGVSPLQLRTAAMALLRHGQRMPSNRREELTEIIARYYGRREISEEDLERALLVGMSPHERRRFAKKKGLTLKNSEGSSSPGTVQENGTSGSATFAMLDSSEVNASNDLDRKPDAFSRNEDREFVLVKDTEAATSYLYSDSGVIEKKSTSDTNGASAAENFYDINTNEDHENNTSLPNEKVEYCYTGCEGIAPPKYNSKLSLLGHGPHGKQIVDHLSREYGDEGIRQFCQRWRQVFVEALHPRFLPVGWDIMHSGRRDFGEFSVYKPSFNASTSTATP